MFYKPFLCVSKDTAIALIRNLTKLCNIILDVFIQNIFRSDLCNVQFILVELVMAFLILTSTCQNNTFIQFMRNYFWILSTHSLSRLSFVLHITFNTIYPLHEEVVVKEKVYQMGICQKEIDNKNVITKGWEARKHQTQLGWSM